MIDQYRFSRAKDEVIFHYQIKDNIGQLKEKFIHAILKKYLEFDEKYHEIPIENYVADICIEKQIYEIQTQYFYKLKDKLNCFLQHYRVQIIYPMICNKNIIYLDEKRKNKRILNQPSIFWMFQELYGIKPYLKHPHFSLRIVQMNVEEYRQSSKQYASVRVDAIPTELIAEYLFVSKRDYVQLLPKTLPFEFTTYDLAKEAKIPLSLSQITLNVLNELEVVKRVSQKNRTYIYQINV